MVHRGEQGWDRQVPWLGDLKREGSLAHVTEVIVSGPSSTSDSARHGAGQSFDRDAVSGHTVEAVAGLGEVPDPGRLCCTTIVFATDR